MIQNPERPPIQKRSPLEGFLPFFWLALGCAAGIVLADSVPVPVWIWAAGAGIALTLWILARALPESLTITHQLRAWTRADRRLPGAILLAVFFIGGWLHAAAWPDITPAHVAYYNDRGRVEITGTLVEPPDPRDSQINLTVQVATLRSLTSSQTAAQDVSGRVLVQAQPGGDWSYGDEVVVRGGLQTPTDQADFSYRDYLARQGISGLIPYAQAEMLRAAEGTSVKGFLFDLRARGLETLHELFPDPESDLLAGILLGHERGLSPQLQETFRRTGTTHIIAISGFNIAILAGLFTGISTRLFGRKWGAAAAIAGISGYTILVGADAAVLRAAIMGGLGVFGGLFGRRQTGLNSIGIAALGMMLLDPNILWDVGFQLSVAATLGLVLYAQPLEERLLVLLKGRLPEEHAHKLVGPVSEIFLFTIAAQFLTLPVIAYHFEGVSWLAFFANPLILPVQSLVMILGGLAMLGGLLLPGLGQVLAFIAQPFVTYTIRMVTWLGRLPGGEWSVPGFHPLWLVVFYALIFILTLLPKGQRQALFSKALSPRAGALVVFGLTVLVWSRVLSAPDGHLNLTLLDEEGTILIQLPAGNTVLIGGGPRPSHLNQRLGEFLPVGTRRLDVAVIGSTYREDINALTGSLLLYPPGLALWNGDPETNQTTRAVFKHLVEEDVPLSFMAVGESLDLGGDIALEVLWTGERGAVLWLEWREFSALLPTGKVEDHWLDVPGAPDILLLPDGVKADEFPLAVVNLWNPSAILLPLAESDLPLFGEHDVLAVLEGYPVLTTYEHGWVRVSTDGGRVWFAGEDRRRGVLISSLE